MTWVATTETEREAMLALIGVKNIEELFDTIPSPLRASPETFSAIPPAMPEIAVRRHLSELAAKNEAGLVSFLGGGFYDHYVPAAVDSLASRGEFSTAYTPYQAECAQGTLQSIYEYQSLICRLTELDCANASLYDGGTALFEATTMAIRITGQKRILCHHSLNPFYRRMLQTHVANLDLELVKLTDNGEPNFEGAACVIAQNPTFLGTVQDHAQLAKSCHQGGALLVLVFYPISLGTLKTPGEMGADIAVAEG